jgi:hypothetical protein
MTTIAQAALAVFMVAAAAGAYGDETAVRLTETAEVASVRTYCSVCHSLDYIQMNSPFLKKAGWEAEVRKMIKVMGAPVPEDEIPRIVSYLTQNYGAE